MTARAQKRDPATGAYARALLAIGIEQGKATEFADELDALAVEVTGPGPFRVFYESPKVPRRERKEVIERALTGRVSEPVLYLVLILIDRSRQRLLAQIAVNYRELLDQSEGRVYAKVTSAAVLDQALQSRLESLLTQKLSKKVVLEVVTNENLIGGMTIQVGDVVVDGSVRTQLAAMRERIAAPRLGKELLA